MLHMPTGVLKPTPSSQAQHVLCPAREKPPAFRTELNGIERRERIAGVEKYAARGCLRWSLAFGYVARKEFAPKLWVWVCRTQLYAE